MKTQKQQKTSTQSLVWDLNDLYPGMESAELKNDLAQLEKLAKQFNQNYKGTIANSASSDQTKKAENLAAAILDYEKIQDIMGRLSSYAYLNYASDLSNPKNTAFYQNISENLQRIGTELVFFDLEVNQLSKQELEALINLSTTLKKYQPFLRDIQIFKDHQLSEDLEKLLLEKSATSSGAWVRLFDEIINNLEFTLDNKKLNSAQIFDLLSNKDRGTRQKAASEIARVLKDNNKTLTYITNILAKDKDISDKWRKFAKPISARNLNNFIEDEIVENLVQTVQKNYAAISHRYYRIKAGILGQQKLAYFDRNAPLQNQDETHYSWDEAKEIVLTTYNNFSPQMAEIGQKFFDNNWIDVGPRTGKESGAFAHPTTPSAHPYLLLNFQGKARDVMTLAHELGHGVHQFLSGKQGPLMAPTPLTLSETASVFGEQLTFQEILRREKNATRKKFIIAGKVEDMINTVVRQIAFLSFEEKVHKARKSGEISAEQLGEFWMAVQKDSLGDVFDFADEYQYFWSYIPHFIHSPFYVYSYAFGDCLVNSLYASYQQHPQGFEKKYLAMLEAGGTKHHKDLLVPFGLSAGDTNFWQQGLNVLISYIDNLE